MPGWADDVAFTIFVTLPVLLLALAATQYWTRGTPLRRLRSLDPEVEVPAPETDDFLRLATSHLETSFAPGHRLELFFAGDPVFERLLEDLSRAEELITWHVFWLKPGDLADRLQQVLVERARAGVQVLFLHDWYGSRGVDSGYYRTLRDAGVEVYPFRKPTPLALYKFNQRSHVRTVTIDGRIGWTGGFAIADEWTGDGRSPGAWRDTSVRLEGPSVHALQAAFAVNWLEATGQFLLGARFFPDHGSGLPDGRGAEGGEASATAEAGSAAGDDGAVAGPWEDRTAGLFFSAPSLGGTRVERLFALTLGAVRRKLWITSAYFVPDREFRQLLCDAARRGVDVRILTPGENTDERATWYVARLHYEELMEAGVRIWEYTPTMVHAKTLLADDVWCAVGTTNFDNRSLALNDEVSLLVHDRDVAGALARVFEKDLEHADELDLDRFRRRGLWGRVKERLWWIFARLL